jgi:hypothetical protein
MPQQIVYTDDAENRIVNCYKTKWNLSKAETIKKMIKEFKER